jgi:HTH-type transcriptional regulator, sugar sensing transcriptional regulator
MNYSSYVNMIKELGLTEYEAKCYLALFERESLSAIEVMNLAGIPRPNTYEALKKLLAKGLCVSMPGKTKRFAATDPRLLKEKALGVINTSLDTEIEELERRKTKAIEKKKLIEENIDTVVDKLQVLFTTNRVNDRPLGNIEMLHGTYQIHRKFVQLCNEAKREIVTFKKPPFSYSTAEQEKEQVQTQIAVGKRGVKTLDILELPSDELERISYVEQLRAGIYPPLYEERVLENLPMKLAIFDEKVVLFTLEASLQSQSSLTSLIAEHPAMAKSFRVFFSTFWERAMPTEDYYKSEMARMKTRGKSK